ncbi:hypothetical protein [Methanobacterium sp.]|uniref:hypothetical protein n=1 Tax=Methanobacterium sp. TaxID=2164 RepID=UPI0025D9C8B0|nr:hypothetical protein [Methanobacterium sp.]MBI5460461.1 hypothetical protein [Methanobacterium sp.]
MKIHRESKDRVKDHFVYRRKSKRGWSIVIMLDNIRIDNFHGFPHIHIQKKAGYEEIGIDDPDLVYFIVMDHLERENGLNIEKLKEELE